MTTRSRPNPQESQLVRYPRRRAAPVASALTGAVLLGACAPEDDVGARSCPAELAPGDLVVTEIMANPAGPDRGREWFELYNASPRRLELGGFTIAHSREDGSDEKRHTLRGVSVEPGEYLVLGGMPARDLLDHVDYGYGNALGLLRNSGGRLAVSCGELQTSEVTFGPMADGVAWGFDGGREVQYAAAAEYDNWCPAETEYAPGDRGTPGAPNDPCGREEVKGCRDGEVLRDPVPPQPGEVAISELMPRSGAVPDARGEWLELRTFADVDLNGLAVALDGTPRLTLQPEEQECLHFPAGSFVLLARDDDSSTNGGLPPVDFTFSFFLPNSGARTLSLHHGEETIDSVSYEAQHVQAGASILRDLDSGTLCVTPREEGLQFGDGDYGTPGAENPRCPVDEAELLAEGRCADGHRVREVEPPRPGAVLITELMPNSGAVPDADGEWIELEVLEDVDLNSLEIVSDGGTRKRTLSSEACLRYPAGSFLVLARNEDPAVNGGLPRVDFTFSFFLPNSGTRTLSLRHGETLVDAVTYGTGDVHRGVSILRDPDSGSFCPTPRIPRLQFGDGDYGTPGERNPSCEEASDSEPELPDEPEPLDELEPRPEACGSTDAGADATCSGDPEPDSLPDGHCEDATGFRALEPPAPGDLLIREIMANNASPLFDRDGEWFELEVLADVDLNGLEVSHDGQPRFTLEGSECLHFPAGSRVLLARSSDSEVNGGLPPVDFTFRFNLVNRPASLAIQHGGVLLDEVEYPNPPSGRSIIRDPETGKLCATPREAELEYHPNNFGSPGIAPPPCP